MAEEKLTQVDDKQPFQNIIEVCESNIEDAKEKEQDSFDDEGEE